MDFRGGRVKAPALAGFQMHHKDPLLADLPFWSVSNRGSAMLLGVGSARIAPEAAIYARSLTAKAELRIFVSPTAIIE